MKAEKEITTKQQVLTEMDRAWDDLQSTISNVDADDLTERTDAAGWSAKDHLAHLSAWANSVLVMIRDGRPQHEGLGIDEATYETEGYDLKNEVIRQARAGMSLPEVQADLEHVYRELTRVLRGCRMKISSSPAQPSLKADRSSSSFTRSMATPGATSTSITCTSSESWQTRMSQRPPGALG